jgi:hypothetical protein
MPDRSHWTIRKFSSFEGNGAIRSTSGNNSPPQPEPMPSGKWFWNTPASKASTKMNSDFKGR